MAALGNGHFIERGIARYPDQSAAANPAAAGSLSAVRSPQEQANSKMKTSLVFLFCAVVPWAALGAADATRLEFDFAASDHGFVAGFADHPLDDSFALYQLTNTWRARPANLGGSPALFISGVNRSDDLFMFWKRRITGLPANTPVTLTMQVQMASKYAEGLLGVGGSPGEGVTVKAGGVAFEPQAVVAPGDGWLRMNLDKGNQRVGGTNMLVIGDVAKPADGNQDYVLLQRHHHGRPFTVTTAGDGSLWLIFGTDSGFEGQTALYYTRLTVWINRADQPYLWLERDSLPGTLRVIWNQGTLRSKTALEPDWPAVPVTTRPYTHNMQAEPTRFWRISQP
ncbi:MAG: hypothetical protein RJA22_789 [Verrucomicrobiota bacterium]|jgi:hypothetical protein